MQGQSQATSHPDSCILMREGGNPVLLPFPPAA